MRGERERSVEALVGRYGISRRLATRVIALLAKQVDISATLLAAAGEDEGLQGLLLSPELVSAPETVNEEWLRSRADQLAFRDAPLLRLIHGPDEGWRTIALEDDLLIEQALGARDEATEAGMGALLKAAPREISLRETEDLFTPEEVAQLKLSALTSQEPDERIEALRKLVFAPMDGGQKAGIFLNVLTDREAEPKVRREAIRSLEQIGFRSDMAEAVRGLFQENQEETIYAVQRLGALLGEAEAGEAALVLAVVLEVFEQSRNAETTRELLRLIGKSAPVLVTNYQKAEQFFQSAVRQLARDFEELRPGVEGALAACAESAPELVSDLLWRELDRNESPRVRSLLINVSEAVVRTPARIAELAERAVAEVLNAELPEAEKARIRYGLVRVGEPAVLAALEHMATASAVEASELIRLLDVLCTESDVTDQTVQKAVTALLDLLKLADTVTRRQVLQTSLLADQRVETALQSELAGELLTLMTELSLPDSLDLIQNALERIGVPALAPACQFMRRSYPSEPAGRAALAVGRIVQEAPDEVGDDLARQILQFCTELLAKEDLEQGAFTIMLAATAGYTRVGADFLEPALRTLKDNLWALPYSLDALDALGIMAGSVNAQPAHQDEVFELLDRIVSYQGRSGLERVREKEGGVVYEFGREIEFDIRVVPSAVKGLQRIGVSRQASELMRTQIAKRLLILWEGVSKARIIWGPAAIEALVTAMCRLACSPQAAAETKERLGASLLRFLNKMTVVRSIGDICSQPDPSPPMRALALEAGERMLDEWVQCDLQDIDRKLALLQSVGRIAANAALDRRSDQVRKLRERTLQALFSGLREGNHRVRDPLLMLRDCPHVTAAQKREIDERLSKAFGLVRIGRQG